MYYTSQPRLWLPTYRTVTIHYKTILYVSAVLPSNIAQLLHTYLMYASNAFQYAVGSNSKVTVHTPTICVADITVHSRPTSVYQHTVRRECLMVGYTNERQISSAHRYCTLSPSHCIPYPNCSTIVYRTTSNPPYEVLEHNDISVHS